MALSNDALYPQGINTKFEGITGAIGSSNTLTPTGTFLVYTAEPTYGTVVTSVLVYPNFTFAATVVALYGSTDGGATKYLINQINMPAQTISTTVSAKPVDFGYSPSNPLILAPGETLYAGRTVGSGGDGTLIFSIRGRDMSDSFDPVFPQAITSSSMNLSNAIASPGSMTPTGTQRIMTISDNGYLVTSLTAIARETMAACVYILYSAKFGNTSKYCINQISVPAQTVSTTSKGTLIDFGYSASNPLLVAPDEELFIGKTITGSNVVSYITARAL